MHYLVKKISGGSDASETIVRKFDDLEAAHSFASEMNVYEQYRDRGPLDRYVVVDSGSGKEIPRIGRSIAIEAKKKQSGACMKIHKEGLKKLIRGAIAEQAKLAKAPNKIKTMKEGSEQEAYPKGLKRFSVHLTNIEWDTDMNDGSEPESAEALGLPSELVIRVDAFSKEEALDYALDRASDDFSFLIQGTVPKFTVEPKEPEYMDITQIVREMVKEEIARLKKSK